MPFLKNPYSDLTTSRIETLRCILVPFSTDGRVDIHELQREFAKANKNLYVVPIIPTYEEELEYVRKAEEKIARWEEFENFILEKDANRLLGCGWLRVLESWELNIGIWMREDMQGKWYATEVYAALIDWAGEYTDHTFLKHSLHPDNEPSRRLALKFEGVLQSEKTERWHDIYHIPCR